MPVTGTHHHHHNLHHYHHHHHHHHHHDACCRQGGRGHGCLVDSSALLRQLQWTISHNVVPEELPSIFVQHVIALKRQGQITIGTPFVTQSQSQVSFSPSEALPLPQAAFLPAIPLLTSRDLPLHLTQSRAALAGVSHSRSNVLAFDLNNFDLEARSIILPSPLLGSSSSSDGLLDELRAGSVVRFHI